MSTQTRYFTLRGFFLEIFLSCYGQTVNDSDQRHRSTTAGKRIASLLPATTEIVAALGRIGDLVAVTFECDYPIGVRNGRGIAVGSPMAPDLTPGEIDDFVRARMASGLPLYELNSAVISALSPQIVLTQDLCRVCALPAGEVSAALDRLGCDATVVTYDPHSVDDVLVGIREIADAIGASAEGKALVASLRSRRNAVVAEVSDGVTRRARPSVLVLEWTDPPFIAGHWVPELVTTAGGEALLALPGERSTTVTWDDAEACAPDVVLVAPCGFGLDDAVAQARQVAGHFPNATIWAIDGNAYVTRPGPRLIDAMEAIAAALHDSQATPGVTALVR